MGIQEQMYTTTTVEFDIEALVKRKTNEMY